ncbi:MAG: alpha/beta fold hydrolase [Planctomycetota bacterium]|nr:alpha/beta fold hydrolase [Planctomycetota bacterium]
MDGRDFSGDTRGEVTVAARAGQPKGKIHFRRCGVGPVLLMVHGFPLSGEMWQNQLQELSSHFDCLVPDLRGFGDSSPIFDGWSVADFAEDLACLLEGLQIENVIFCGLSLGGYVGLEFLDRFPEKLSQVVFCNTRAEADDGVAARARRLMAERVRREGNGFLSREMLPRLLAEVNQDAELQPDLRQLFRAASVESIALTQIAMANRRDFSGQMANGICPTTLVGGDDDRITPAEQMEQWSDSIPGSCFWRIKRAGHLPPLENPAEFNRVLRSLLS